MKKKGLMITIALLLVLTICLGVGCSYQYGDAFADMDDLKEEMTANDLTMLYPTFVATGDKKEKFNFVSVYDNETSKTFGYKAYHFTAPFDIAVYGYNSTAEDVYCDDITRLTEHGTVDTIHGVATLYKGEGFEEALFLIGVIDIDGQRYEVRIVGNNDKEDFINDEGKEDSFFANAIYQYDTNYILAIAEMQKLFAGLIA